MEEIEASAYRIEAHQPKNSGSKYDRPSHAARQLRQRAPNTAAGLRIEFEKPDTLFV